MNKEEALKVIEEYESKQSAYSQIMSTLFYDSETVAPKDSTEGRGRAFAEIGNLQFEGITNPKLKEAVDYLSPLDLGLENNRKVELIKKEVEQISRVPKEEYIEYVTLVDEATVVWKDAKSKADFSIFKPYLEKMIKLTKKMAKYYNPEMEPYDSLLNMYEEGLNVKTCDKFFSDLRNGLKPILDKVLALPEYDDSYMFFKADINKQREFTNELVRLEGLNMDRLAIGEVEHPFTDGANNHDIRITTHYYENNFLSSMYSILHEGGHAMYEQNIEDKYNFTVLYGGVSMGIHESQSRFYENIIGRSYAFTKPLLEAAKKCFPTEMKDITHEMFYKAANKAKPTLIRVDADELTYAFHIMVRYEIEKMLINEDLPIDEVPRVWNELYKKYLGIEPKNDSEGCLQDSHWAGGNIGYFPSYALGSAYGAQMLYLMEKDNPNMYLDIEKGDLSYVTSWLKEHIHKYGSLYKPGELFKKACGEFDAKYYINYLEKKMKDVYGI